MNFHLYGAPYSPYCMYPYSQMMQLNLDVTWHFVDLKAKEHKQDWFLKLNPIGKIPTFKHEDISLGESFAIQ